MKKNIFIGILVISLVVGVFIYNSLNGKGDALVSEDKVLSELIGDDIAIELPVGSEINKDDTEKENDSVDEEKDKGMVEQKGTQKGVKVNSYVGQPAASEIINKEKEVDVYQDEDKIKRDSSEIGSQNETKEETEEIEPIVTANSIKEKYRPSFEELERQAKDKLESMMDVALDEYKEKKETGEKVSFLSFYSKYKSAAEALEEKVDDSFNEIYSKLEYDLEKNQLPTSEAQEFKEKYESSKKGLRKELLSKALSYF